MGEEMCAFVRLKSNQIETTEKELKDFCKGKVIPSNYYIKIIV